MIIAVDFDGTCVAHEFPEIGHDIGAIPVLKKIIENGHNIVLCTIRDNRHKLNRDTGNIEICDIEEESLLYDAIRWFEENDIKLYGVNNNPDQFTWSWSRKIYARYYIDDSSIGCPLVYPKSGRPYVSWKKVSNILHEMNII